MPVAQAHRLAPPARPEGHVLARLQRRPPRLVRGLVQVVGAAVLQPVRPVDADLLLGKRQ
ncbi:MAG: hypothetical protein WKG07_23105 [Hymenobacter sp.]